MDITNALTVKEIYETGIFKDVEETQEGMDGTSKTIRDIEKTLSYVSHADLRCMKTAIKLNLAFLSPGIVIDA